MSRGFLFLALACAAAALSPAAAANPAPRACEGMTSMPSPGARSRPVGPLDLLRLRDIGYMHLGPGQRLIALSPDKSHAAFVMHRADPATNRYCVALIVLELGGAWPPRILDQGDDLLMEAVTMRGMEVEYGLPRPLLPSWSPDGKRIAYLRKADGLAQIVEVTLANGNSRQLSHSPVGVEQFARVTAGTGFVYRDRPSRLAARTAISQEGDKGYLVDDRILPYAGTTPAIRTPLPEELHHVTADGTRIQLVTADDRARLDAARANERAASGATQSMPSGWTLAKTQAVPGSYSSPTYMIATRPDGRKLPCNDPACRGSLFADIEGAWESDRPGEFVYLKRDGWGASQYGLYLWKAGQAPRRLLLTDDLLLGCESLGARLLCARERALRPRHLVTIDLRHGAHMQELFDPNADYLALAQPHVERLRWRNAHGQESFGDLILPAQPVPGRKLPLVVVQYVSRGFLRGGTGDEYPIPAFVQNGFAVLSFHKPSPLFAVEGNDDTLASILPRLNEDWADRRNIHSTLIAGLGLVLTHGDIDAQRIGISGVSDGSTTVQFGLINSPGLFKTASIGSCCVDPTAMMIYGGSGLARERTAWGYPPVFGPGSQKWQPLALAHNPPSLMAPLLMQLADSEFIVAMETLAAYEKAGRPIEARIFPQEHHLKAQPRHRLALYCRNLRWFGFWLDQPIATAACPADVEDMKRWTDMKAHAAKSD